MSFARLHKLVTYLFATLGFVAFAMGADLGVPTLAFFAVSIVASVFAEGRILVTFARYRVWTIATVAALFVQVARALLGESPFSLGLEYAGFLQITRLADRRSATEHLHVVGLGFLHLVIGAVLTTGLEFAVAIAGFVIVAPWMLTLTHLRGEIERRHGVPIAGALPTERVRRALASTGIAGRGFFLGSALLSIPLVLTTAAIFFAFPRVGVGFLTFDSRPQARVAGFGNDVDLASFGTIRDDPTVVVRLFATQPAGDPLRASPMRLRGTSFARYEAGRWTRDAEDDANPARHNDVVDLGSRSRARGDLRYRLLVEPLEGAPLFLPEGTTALELAPRATNGFDRSRILLVSGRDVRLGEPDGFDRDYTVSVDPSFTGYVEHLDDDDRARLTALPRDSERLSAFAASIVAGAKGPRDEAMRLLAELRDSNRYTYTTDIEDPGRADPLELFLFERRRGHCEFFSSALAVLLRARGIPARNVSGFLGGRYNEFGHYVAFRQGDAHSWVEAYIDGAWVTLDPTPPSRDAFAPPHDLLSTTRELIDALRTRWARDVVGYDVRRQVALLLELRSFFERLRHANAAASSARIRSSDASLVSARVKDAIVAVLVVAGLVLAGIAAHATATRVRSRRRLSGAAERLYRELDVLLARRGKARPPGRTPFEHVAFLEAEGDATAPHVRRITELYANARYRDVGLTKEAEAEVRAELRRLARSA